LITFFGNLTYFIGDFRSSNISCYSEQWYSSKLSIAVSLESRNAVSPS